MNSKGTKPAKDGPTDAERDAILAKELEERLKDSLRESDSFSELLRDREEIWKLIKVLEFLQTFNDRMEVQQMLTALYAFYLGDAERTPKNLREILDLPSSTVSRNTAQLSDIGIRDKPGYGWIGLETDRWQRNRKLITLTKKGRQVRRMIANFMRGDV